jgi:hypothetical protein
MGILKTTSGLLVIICLATFLSCCCSREGDYDFSLNNQFFFTILDKATRGNILEIGQHSYNYDTLAIFDQNWQRKSGVAFDGKVHIQFIEPDADKNKVRDYIERRFYMYFNYQDIDTVDIKFKMKFSECDAQIPSYFKVSYNNTTYYDKSTERIPNLEFLK